MNRRLFASYLSLKGKPRRKHSGQMVSEEHRRRIKGNWRRSFAFCELSRGRENLGSTSNRAKNESLKKRVNSACFSCLGPSPVHSHAVK